MLRRDFLKFLGSVPFQIGFLRLIPKSKIKIPFETYPPVRKITANFTVTAGDLLEEKYKIGVESIMIAEDKIFHRYLKENAYV